MNSRGSSSTLDGTNGFICFDGRQFDMQFTWQTEPSTAHVMLTHVLGPHRILHAMTRIEWICGFVERRVLGREVCASETGSLDVAESCFWDRRPVRGPWEQLCMQLRSRCTDRLPGTRRDSAC